MKFKTLWKSISALIVVLLIIMAFFRGSQSQWFIVGAFGVWAAFIMLVLVKSLFVKIGCALGSFLVKCTHGKEGGQIDMTQLLVENREVKIALMNQIILRITENLHYCYPDATWKWVDKNPLDRILNQEPCRITISNIKEFNFADVQINAKGALGFEFGKKVSLNEIRQNAKEEIRADIADSAGDWFSAEGNRVLSNIICELNAAGYTKLFISATGEITILKEGLPQILETDFHMPAISLDRLKDLLKTVHLNAEIDGDKLAILV